MADKSQLSTEDIASEIINLREQMRSFALQRAEGLIDANMQRDLVNNLQARIAELEMSQTAGDNPSAVVDDSTVDVDVDTPEKPEMPPVDADSIKGESSEAQVIEELFDKGDTFEQPKVTSAAAESVEIPKVSAVSEKLEHGEAQVIEELFDKGDTFEQPKVSVNGAVDDSVEVHKVQEMTPIESSETGDEPSEEPDVESDDQVTDDESNFDDLVIEEDHNPLRRDEQDDLAIGKLVDDVVVSSAMVKEPDYLDAIEPSRNSIHEPLVVDIRDITKTYQMGELELEVLKGVTLQIKKGELVAIMGPSGSGKSTLMNILGALDKPTDGEYFLDGVDVSKMNEKQLAEIRNQKIGFVFQSFNLLKRTSAIRQVELPLIYGSHKDRTRMAREALEAVGLGQRLDHTPAELSGGQQQRVAIARALVTNPSIVLADEPTGNLDSRSGTEVMQIFQNLNRKNNITTILVTHDVWIARHTNRVIMLRDGKVIADHHVKNPLVAGEAERPTETQELQAIFNSTYYEGDEDEYN